MMNAKTGFEAWRERNLSLPSPDEIRTLPDGRMKAVWANLERGWYSLYADSTWDADGTPVGGSMDEEAIGQPDYYSRSLSLNSEDDLTLTLAGYR